jgi:hypothetical protein
MGCGCGGSKRSAEQVPRDQVRRPAARPAGAARGQGDGGFVWRGPRRNPQPTGQQQA